MPLYTIFIHDPDTREVVHTVPHKVRSEAGWKAVKEVVSAYGFTREWPLSSKEYRDAPQQKNRSAHRAGG